MYKRLYRSRDNRIVAGVLGGIGDYFSIDPVLPRLVFFLLTFATGLAPGIIAYLIAVIVIPEAPSITPATPPAPAAEPEAGAHDDTAV